MFFGSEVIEVYNGGTDSTLLLRREVGDNLYKYRLGTLALPDGAYMFTIWAKAMHSMSLNIGMLGQEEVFQLIGGEWTKLKIYNETPSKDSGGNVNRYIDIIPVYYSNYWDGVDAWVQPVGTSQYMIGSRVSHDSKIWESKIDENSNEPGSAPGTDGWDQVVDDLHLYQAMLELSDHASDWSPAPEDDEAYIEGLTERMAAAEIRIEDDNIVSTVLQSERYQNEFSGLQESLETTITHTVREVTMEFAETKEYVDDNKAYIDSSKAYINFDNNGIHMGKDNDPFTMDLSNNELAFNDHGSKVAYINNETMHITNAEITSKMTINGFAFVPTETGMALVYVGS